MPFGGVYLMALYTQVNGQFFFFWPLTWVYMVSSPILAHTLNTQDV